MKDTELISAEVDFGNVSGPFVRLDVAIPRESLYRTTRDDGGPMGWLALTADDADRLADTLHDRAARVRSQST